MKFDPYNWTEVNPNEETKAPKGVLQVMLSKPGALFVSVKGYEVLGGYGTKIDLQVKEEMTFRAEMPDGGRAFYYNPVPETFRPTGEKYTNIDRQPMESGTLLEIKKALRAFEMRRREVLAEIRQEKTSLKRQAKSENKEKSAEDTDSEEKAGEEISEPDKEKKT